MTTVGLIRHGITEWNTLGKAQGISDIPLSEKGKNQAVAVGNRLLQEEKWDMLIISDLSRAEKTGEIIRKIINLPISYVDNKLKSSHCDQGNAW